MRAGPLPSAVIFDLDGTLVDSLPGIAEAMSAALSAHGFSVAPEEVRPRIGPPMDVLVEELTGCPRELALRVDEEYHRRYYAQHIALSRPLPGAESLIDGLGAARVPLAVLTNKVAAGAERMLEVLGWSGRFRAVIGRDSLARPKPAPDGALMLLAQLGAGAERAAIVGDTEFDVRCGRDAGLGYVIAVTGTRPEAALREAGASHVLPSLDAVAAVLLGAGAGGAAREAAS